MTLKEVRRFESPNGPDTQVYVEVPLTPVDGPALACVNHGRWIVHCPRPGCANAMKLEAHQGSVSCEECYAQAPVVWPADAAEITAELARRPNDANRNWYPARHEWARNAGLPVGQTVADLAQEFRERTEADA